ncbi:hypothetical protein ACP70R_004518 [Stipagrostis hirtigluma subsp. patula]
MQVLETRVAKTVRSWRPIYKEAEVLMVEGGLLQWWDGGTGQACMENYGRNKSYSSVLMNRESVTGSSAGETRTDQIQVSVVDAVVQLPSVSSIISSESRIFPEDNVDGEWRILEL